MEAPLLAHLTIAWEEVMRITVEDSPLALDSQSEF